MKKKLLLFVMFFAFISRVDALGISINSSSYSITKGNNVKVSVQISSENPIFFIEGTLKCSGASVNGGIDLNFDNTSNNVYSKTYTYSFTPSSSGVVTCTSKGVRLIDTSSDAWRNIQDKSISITVREPAVIPPKSYSSNNYLESLSIEGYQFKEKFDKNTLEYTVDVPNGVEKVLVKATLEDNKSSIKGIGEQTVLEGENVLEVKVTAENGTEKIYKIKVNVLELDPIYVTIDNKKYTVVRKNDVKELPNATFKETTLNIDGEDVLAYTSDITKYTIVLLKDENLNYDYYLYNDGKYSLYREYKFGGISLYITNKELSNSDYKKVNFKYLDDELEGYIFSPRESKILKNTFSASNNSKYYLFYAVNTLNGSESLYQFDVVENTVQKYNSEEVDFYKDMAHTYYLYVLVLLGTIVIIFLLLLVALVIKKNKSKKRNIVRDNDVVVIKEDNNDLDKDISNELEDNNYNKEELPIKDAKEELNDKNNKKKKKKKMEFEEL